MEDTVFHRVKSVFGKTFREGFLLGYFLRANALMTSLRKLNQTEDFQSIHHCNRSLLEIVTDMIFLHHDKTDDTANKIAAWADSAVLQNCQRAIDFFDNKGEKVPEEYKDREDFVNKEGSRIKKRRKSLWGKEGHPKSWLVTINHNGKMVPQDLSQRVREASTLHPRVEGYLADSIEKIYKMQYGQQCWYVHGSGFTGIRNMSEEIITGTCALAYISSADLALECCRVILRDYKFEQHMEELKDEWDKLREIRSKLILGELPEQKEQP